jgi:hypothetical protein
MPKDDYTIGRGKPPTDKQFKPGQSGNPAGRPKGSKNFRTDFMEELQLKIEITEGGKKQEVTKQRAIIKRMINGAMSGEVKAADAVMKLSLAFTDPEDMATDNQLSAEELKLLEAFVDNQRGGGDGNK